MLKHHVAGYPAAVFFPAAFRRLCVETRYPDGPMTDKDNQPPSGGCVLKLYQLARSKLVLSSRLQAAVC